MVNYKNFESEALSLFKFQFEKNPVYRSFCDLINVQACDISSVTQIPFLPIELFKTHKIISSNAPCHHVFKSSGTEGKKSVHYVTEIDLYSWSFRNGFSHFFGNVTDYVILGLLPNYLEQGESSLIHMVDDLIVMSDKEESGFYLSNFEELNNILRALENRNQKTLLWGVSYALLDFIEQFPQKLIHTQIIETGGMKGRRKELIKEELYTILKKGLGVNDIYSEYGMTELLTQAYAINGIFSLPPWARVFIRKTNDPLNVQTTGAGGLNIIDLANRNSCAFIATQDLGRVFDDNRFEVLGRFDQADIRGCNLMVS